MLIIWTHWFKIQTCPAEFGYKGDQFQSPSPPTAACCWIYFKYHALPMTRDQADILLRAFWVPASAALWGKSAQNCAWTVNSVSVIKTLNCHHSDIMFFKSKCFRVNIRYDVLILLAMCYFKNCCSQSSTTDWNNPI